MRFIDYIEPNNIDMQIPFSSKKKLFEQLAMKMGANTQESRQIYDALVKREKLGVTSLGNGVALPHGQCLEDKNIKMHITVLNKPVNYESVDDTLVQLIVCILFPKKTDEFHNRVLKNLGKFFKKHRVFRNIISATSAKQIQAIILDESK
ncbi:MAG: PTS sugar transporter subunit IIA [Proteobacteria bacterium]|nr:PTS sugar transporter subunit IIA [Pseudomonadota bacterium]